jgi:hypothetical protein
VEANGTAITVARRTPVDGCADRKYAPFGSIEASALRVDFTWRYAQSSEYCIVKRFSYVDVVGADHDMAEHSVFLLLRGGTIPSFQLIQ